MVNNEIILKLLSAFPGSWVNDGLEFIAHTKANEYFSLENCQTKLDVKCKVLEWLSRAAYKSEPFASGQKNIQLHGFMLAGINDFLGTNFTEKDMETIYTYLGNACNHLRTIGFIQSGYDMAFFNQFGKQ